MPLYRASNRPIDRCSGLEQLAAEVSDITIRRWCSSMSSASSPV